METAVSAGFVLGIDFGGTKVALRTARPSAETPAYPATPAFPETLGSAVLPTLAERGAAQVVSRTLARAARLVADTERAHGGRLRSVAAVSPGIVLADRILLAPNVPGWDRLSLARLLADGMGRPHVRVGTDAKAGALAESRWGVLAGVPCGILLNLGTGIAIAVVVEGRVLDGAHGAAGEIGYALVEPGQAGFRQGRAPLEEQVSGSGMAAHVSALLRRPVTTAQAFALAADDGAVRGVLDRALDLLAQHVANLAIVLDPAVVAVAGGVTHNELVLPRIMAALAGAVPFPPALVPARFRTEAPLMGALAMALDALEDTPAARADVLDGVAAGIHT